MPRWMAANGGSTDAATVADLSDWSENRMTVTDPASARAFSRATGPNGSAAREKARALAGSVTVIRFSDQSLRSATVAASVLPPFAAIHLGIACLLYTSPRPRD